MRQSSGGFNGSWVCRICGKWWASKSLNLSQTATAFKHMCCQAQPKYSRIRKNIARTIAVPRKIDSQKPWHLRCAGYLNAVDMPDMSWNISPSYWLCCAKDCKGLHSTSQWWNFWVTHNPLCHLPAVKWYENSLSDPIPSHSLHHFTFEAGVTVHRELARGFPGLWPDLYHMFGSPLLHAQQRCVHPFKCKPIIKLSCWYIYIYIYTHTHDIYIYDICTYNNYVYTHTYYIYTHIISSWSSVQEPNDSEDIAAQPSQLCCFGLQVCWRSYHVCLYCDILWWLVLLYTFCTSLTWSQIQWFFWLLIHLGSGCELADIWSCVHADTSGGHVGPTCLWKA